MKNKVLKEPIYAERIVNAVKLSCSMEEMRNKLKDYHDNDIAQSFEFLNRAERNLCTAHLMRNGLLKLFLTLITRHSISKKLKLINWLKL